jgi:hypothetical protein
MTADTTHSRIMAASSAGTFDLQQTTTSIYIPARPGNMYINYHACHKAHKSDLALPNFGHLQEVTLDINARVGYAARGIELRSSLASERTEVRQMIPLMMSDSRHFALTHSGPATAPVCT